MNTINTCKIKITPIPISEVMTYIHQHKGGTCIQITGVNMEQISLIARDPNFSHYINQSDIVNIDGVIVYLYLKLRGFKHVNRTLCADLLYACLSEANRNNDSVYFLGATQNVVENVVQKISDKYPNVRIVGYNNGYYTSEKEIIEHINSFSPTYLFLGMPSPMKERFIAENRSELKAKVCLGVGGMFDIIAEKAKRAPLWIQKCGLEWLFRIYQNPIGHSRRLMRAIFPCMRIFLKYLFEKKTQVIDSIQ